MRNFRVKVKLYIPEYDLIFSAESSADACDKAYIHIKDTIQDYVDYDMNFISVEKI